MWSERCRRDVLPGRLQWHGGGNARRGRVQVPVLLGKDLTSRARFYAQFVCGRQPRCTSRCSVVARIQLNPDPTLLFAGRSNCVRLWCTTALLRHALSSVLTLHLRCSFLEDQPAVVFFLSSEGHNSVILVVITSNPRARTTHGLSPRTPGRETCRRVGSTKASSLVP